MSDRINAQQNTIDLSLLNVSAPFRSEIFGV